VEGSTLSALTASSHLEETRLVSDTDTQLLEIGHLFAIPDTRLVPQIATRPFSCDPLECDLIPWCELDQLSLHGCRCVIVNARTLDHASGIGAIEISPRISTSASAGTSHPALGFYKLISLKTAGWRVYIFYTHDGDLDGSSLTVATSCSCIVVSPLLAHRERKFKILLLCAFPDPVY